MSVVHPTSNSEIVPVNVKEDSFDSSVNILDELGKCANTNMAEAAARKREVIQDQENSLTLVENCPTQKTAAIKATLEYSKRSLSDQSALNPSSSPRNLQPIVEQVAEDESLNANSSEAVEIITGDVNSNQATSMPSNDIHTDDVAVFKVIGEDSSNSSLNKKSTLKPSSSLQDPQVSDDSEDDDLDLSEINMYESTEEDYDSSNTESQESHLEMEYSNSNSENREIYDYESSLDCTKELQIKTEPNSGDGDAKDQSSTITPVKKKGKRIPQFKRNMVKPADYNFTDLNKLEPGNNQCHVCKKTFELRNKLLAHFSIHPPDNPFLFDLSKKGSVIMNIDRVPPTPEELKAKPFCCALCPKRFRNYGGLVAHCCVHTGEKPYVCNVCSKAYRDKQYLKGHALLHKGQALYECDLCRKSFTRRQNLKVHYLTHTGERPHVCDICHATFRKKHLMIIHCRIHTNDYPFSCKACGRRFRSKNQLVSHTLTHEQNTPHQCEKCPKSFNQKRWLMKHMEFHEGKRPYECSECFKCFVRKLELEVHMAFHTGKWPFVCDICDKGFTKPCYLKVHKQIHMEGAINELLPLNLRGRPMNVPYEMPSNHTFIKTNMNDKHSLLRSMLQS